MTTDEILHALRSGNGATFWVAAAAIAALATVLVIAFLLAVRRLRARGRARPAAAPGRRRRGKPVPAVPAVAADGAPPAGDLPAVLRAAGRKAYAAAGEGAAGPAANPAPAADGGVEPGSAGGTVRLVPLLGRLREAAARLEEYVASARDEASATAEETPLKSAASAVEYVYRAEA